MELHGSRKVRHYFDSPDILLMPSSPSMTGTLWDVTDRDIDRLTEELCKKLHLDDSHLSLSTKGGPGLLPISDLSNVEAVGASRDACKLKYLTGAAPVVYGIPMYMH
jgi:separase